MYITAKYIRSFGADRPILGATKANKTHHSTSPTSSPPMLSTNEIVHEEDDDDDDDDDEGIIIHLFIHFKSYIY